MTTPNTAQPTSLRRFNRIGCVLLPLIVVAVTYVSYRLSARSAERALDAEIARLRAAGIIVPVNDLIPKVPPGERNAADVYEQASAAFPPVSDAEGDLLLIEQSDDPARIKLAVAMVDQNKAYFDLVDKASSLPYCALPMNWSDPYSSSGLRTRLISPARWQAVRAEALLARHRPDDALLCPVTSLRIAEHLKAEPTIIAQVCAYIVQSIAAESISVVVSRGDPSPHACRQAFEFLASIDNAPAFVAALRGEISIFDMALVEHPYSTGSFGGGVPGPPGHGLNPSWQEMIHWTRLGATGKAEAYEFLRDKLRYDERLLRASSLPWPELRSAFEQADVGLTSVLPVAPVKAQLQAAAAAHSQTAQLHASQIALAATAYKAEHGTYPKSLGSLTAAGWNLPDDPFSGKPLHYRRETDGFIVWSVGPNLVDDNAAEMSGDSTSTADSDGDVVFRCDRTAPSPIAAE